MYSACASFNHVRILEESKPSGIEEENGGSD